MGARIVFIFLLSCLIVANCDGESSCAGISGMAYEYMVKGSVTLPRAETDVGTDYTTDVTTYETMYSTTEETTYTYLDSETAKMIYETTDATTYAEEEKVEIAAHVKLTVSSNATSMTVLSLQMSTPSGQILKNPEGLNKPVIFYNEDLPALENLVTEESDTFLSVDLKKSIINMLRRKIGYENSSYSQIQDILDLLNEGKDNIILFEEYKDLTLILGNTGGGKSTFTHWIADTNNTLTSIDTPGGDFIIEDQQGKVSKETITSKTVYPDLIVDPIENMVYYDMPGFSDTRSSAIEIATSYFTTSVIEHARRLKIVFIVNYSSVRKGLDRSNFPLFLEHVSELINDIYKYRDSIALVVTKVDNNYRRGALVGDEKVKQGIANFLEEVKEVYELNLKDNVTTLQPKKEIFYNKAIQLLNILLTKDEGQYSRIGLFRRPDDAGVINEMSILKMEKNDVKKIIIKDLLYTDSNFKDFGRTISDKSKNNVHDLIEVIEKYILINICHLSNTIQQNLQEELNNTKKVVSTIDINNPIETDSKMYYVNQSIYYLHSKIHPLMTLGNLANTPETIVEQINKMELNVSKKLMSDIVNHGNYLQFLISTLDKENTISQFAWASVLQKISSDISSQLNTVEHDFDELNKKFELKIKGDLNIIKVNLIDKYISIEKNTLDISKLKDKIDSKHYEMAELQKTSDISVFLTKTLDIFNLDNISYASYIPEYVIMKQNHVAYLKEILSDSTSYLQESRLWYEYLHQLIVQFSRSDYQVTSRCYNLSKNITLNDENKEVRLSSLETFLKKCHPGDYIANYEKVKTVTLSAPRLWHLKHLLDLLFKNVTHTCEDSRKMVVKGFNVKMSDVVNRNCSFHFQTLEIFALNKLFIDTDLINHNGIQLAIVAPKWHVLGERSIDLDGLDGKPYLKAKDGLKEGEDGDNGKAGNPGGPGGVFLGIGHEFINSVQYQEQRLYLKISASGGDGGPGQDGGDGHKGRDGAGDELYKYDVKKYLVDKGWWDDKSRRTCEYFVFALFCTFEPLKPDVYCSDGGNGGKGGQRGIGGLRGVVELISTDSDVPVHKLVEDGRAGKTGRSGRPGDPGRSTATATYIWNNFISGNDEVKYTTDECRIGERPPFWELSGARVYPTRTPKIPKKLILEEYESFVKENSVVQSKVEGFLHEIKYKYKNMEITKQ